MRSPPYNFLRLCNPSCIGLYLHCKKAIWNRMPITPMFVFLLKYRLQAISVYLEPFFSNHVPCIIFIIFKLSQTISIKLPINIARCTIMRRHKLLHWFTPTGLSNEIILAPKLQHRMKRMIKKMMRR